MLRSPVGASRRTRSRCNYRLRCLLVRPNCHFAVLALESEPVDPRL
ncbi:MAG: hypothetical protein IMF08_05040 [Proteobacteria bacterium]|nr:hypothetical protein [Pseudomonadota bacterium]